MILFSFRKDGANMSSVGLVVVEYLLGLCTRPLTKDGAQVMSEREHGLVLIQVNGVMFGFATLFALGREIAGEFVRADTFGDMAIDRRHGLCLRPPCSDANSSPHLAHLNLSASSSCFSRRCLRARACRSSVFHGPPPLANGHNQHLIEGGIGKGITT